MSQGKTSSKIDAYLGRIQQWREETAALRKIMLDCGLAEDMKWGKPCYAFEGGNVAVIQGFKAYCALLFFKGVLLPDPDGILVKTGENTVVGRQIRFTDARKIEAMERVLKKYIRAAIAVEKAGLKVETDKAKVSIPAELERAFEKSRTFKAAFESLTPGRQRGYLFHFSGAKQSKTRESRIEKWREQILQGRGMYD